MIDPVTPTALVIEDDPRLRMLVTEMLRERGYQVDEAWSAQGGHLAWRLRKRNVPGGRYALVVTDDQMPAGKHLGMVRAAMGFADVCSRECPVIVWSGLQPDFELSPNTHFAMKGSLALSGLLDTLIVSGAIPGEVPNG